MATIQVRDIPEEQYEVLRRRARRAGQSLQAYMRDRVVELARTPTKQESIERIEAVLTRRHPAVPDRREIVDDLAADRR